MSDAREERWIELLLRDRGPGGEVELEIARDDPATAARLDRLARTIVRVRDAGHGLEAAWSERRQRALVETVLARTTREDLGWRGELGLLGGFVRERLAASRALRLLAASLVAHLLAAPVLAWWIHRAEDPPVRLGFQVAPAVAPEDARSDGQRGESPVPLAVDDPGDGPDAGEVENALARARFLLGRARTDAAQPRASAGEALEIRLLAARSRFLADGYWESFLDERATLERGGSTVAALLSALLLDRYALLGERAQLLEPALGRLKRDAPTSALAALTLTRAQAYGLREAPPGFEPLGHADPWPAPWRQALAGELAPELRGDPVVRNWIQGPPATRRPR